MPLSGGERCSARRAGHYGVLLTWKWACCIHVHMHDSHRHAGHGTGTTGGRRLVLAVESKDGISCRLTEV